MYFIAWKSETRTQNQILSEIRIAWFYVDGCDS